LLVLLVPKLQLGNREVEAPASRDWKLELPGLHSQAGAWERVNSGIKKPHVSDLIISLCHVKIFLFIPFPGKADLFQD